MNNTTYCPVAWSQFQSEVLALYQEPHRRSGTLAKMSQVMREVGAICPTTAELDPVSIARWLAAHPGRAAWTRRTLLSALRAACAWMHWKGYGPNPFGFRSLSGWIPADELQEAASLARHRTEAEIRSVLDQADAEASGGDWNALRLRAAVYCWAYTGAGSSEILGLRVIDVDLPGRMISVRSHPGRRLKTGARAARLPIAEPLAVVLEAWLSLAASEWLLPGATRRNYWHGGAPGYRPVDRVRQLGERAGVPGLTILAFRHSFGTLAEGWGIGELMLQRLLRHSRPTTQRAYRHHDSELLRKAIDKVKF